MTGVPIKHRGISIRRRTIRHDILKEVLMFSARKQSKARLAVLSLALLSATALSPVASAWAVDSSAAPSAPASNPTPINATAQGQMMNMQMAAMQNAAQNTPMDSSFDGNVPKSTSLSANFGWMDTFDANAMNGGYGGGVTMTHWITSKFAVQGGVEIESFGLGAINQVAKIAGVGDQAGTPVIPITLGVLYDFTGGHDWVNPQVFGDAGPAVTLNGESMPLYVDAGFGVTTPLAKISDTLAGINLFANIRWAYLSNISGLANTAVGAIGADGASPAVNGLLTNAADSYKGALNYMPIEFGATFVF